MSIQIVAFAVLGVFGVGEMYFRDQVRVALAARHPDVWRQLRARKGFMANILANFIWRRHDRTLDDPGLSRTTAIAAWLGYLAFAAWLVFAGIFLLRVEGA